MCKQTEEVDCIFHIPPTRPGLLPWEQETSQEATTHEFKWATGKQTPAQRAGSGRAPPRVCRNAALFVSELAQPYSLLQIQPLTGQSAKSHRWHPVCSTDRQQGAERHKQKTKSFSSHGDFLKQKWSTVKELRVLLVTVATNSERQLLLVVKRSVYNMLYMHTGVFSTGGVSTLHPPPPTTSRGN